MTTKTLDYIRRSKEIHNDKYDYSLIKDIPNNSLKLEIICPIHGIFIKTMNSHIFQKAGCEKCSGQHQRTTEEWIAEAKIKHNNIYDYSKVEYKFNKMPVCIICPIHGKFWQTAKEHLTIGTGCPRCKKNYPLNTKTFIEKAISKHSDRYDYTLVDYQGNEKYIKITCKVHGIFEQTPHGHLAGYGCKKCSNHISNNEKAWLNSLNIENLLVQHKLKINGRNYFVDGFDPKTKTVYEYYGDFFHGNPVYYDWMESNKRNDKCFGELYRKTKEKEQVLQNAGYNLVTIWENEWLKIQDKKTKSPLNQNNKYFNRYSFYKQWQDSDEEWNYFPMLQKLTNDLGYEKSEAEKLCEN